MNFIYMDDRLGFVETESDTAWMIADYIGTVQQHGGVLVWHACGKTSPHKYGHPEASRGWDESCMLNSALHAKDKLVYTSGPDQKPGRVMEIRE